MQSYQDIPDTTTLTASRSLLLSNILTAMSQSSGTAFPTTNLVLGMPCYRTDLNKTYVLTNLTGPVWTLEQDNARTVAYLDDTIAAATKLATARTISISGDVTGTATFDGTANAAITGTLAASGVAAGTYAAATITVDAKGRVTSASATTSLVNTFNSRTGAVTLSSADVTGALGFTPANPGANYTYTSIRMFRSNFDTAGGSYAPLMAYSDNSSGATMSFHRAGAYAVNLGLDSDNVWRLGGWSAGASRIAVNMSGQIYGAAYGWLHDYFFSTISNCARTTGAVSGNAGNCNNSANCVTTVANCGNLAQFVTVLEDGGSNVRVNGYQYNFNCNCNCDCNCCC